MAHATPALDEALDPSLLYGPNDHHYVDAGQDEKGRKLVRSEPGLGKEADALLVKSGNPRAARAVLDADRAKLEREREELEELRAQMDRELASLPKNMRDRIRATAAADAD